MCKEMPDRLGVIQMDQMDALLKMGESFLGILAIMALIGLVLALVNFIGRRRGKKPGAPEQSARTQGDPPGGPAAGENDHPILKDKGE